MRSKYQGQMYRWHCLVSIDQVVIPVFALFNICQLASLSVVNELLFIIRIEFQVYSTITFKFILYTMWTMFMFDHKRTII
jgi:hypothetical protein